MNEIPLAWGRIYSTFPEMDNLSDGRGWARNEIQKMLKHTNGAMERALILVAASSATRIGGFDYTWKDLVPIYKIENELKLDLMESEESKAIIACAMLSTYRGTALEYPSFITPEAYDAIMDYKTEWIRDVGKEPKNEEPLFKRNGDLPRKLTPLAIKKRIERIVTDAGLRPPLAKGTRRHDVPLMNGFRRFCNKMLKEALSKDSALGSLIKKEYMMGHSGLVKTDRNYFKTHVLELAEEYLNAVKELTISNEERLHADKVRLQKEKKDFENYAIQQIKQLVEGKEDNFDKMLDYFSFVYEGDPKEKQRKRKLFCRKYNLNEGYKIHAKVTCPPEMQKLLKKLPTPKKIPFTKFDPMYTQDDGDFS